MVRVAKQARTSLSRAYKFKVLDYVMLIIIFISCHGKVLK